MPSGSHFLWRYRALKLCEHLTDEPHRGQPPTHAYENMAIARQREEACPSVGVPEG